MGAGNERKRRLEFGRSEGGREREEAKRRYDLAYIVRVARAGPNPRAETNGSEVDHREVWRQPRPLLEPRRVTNGRGDPPGGWPTAITSIDRIRALRRRKGGEGELDQESRGQGLEGVESTVAIYVRHGYSCLVREVGCESRGEE